MGSIDHPVTPTKELLEAQVHIWSHVYSYHKATSLRCAIELGIPEAIHKHGEPMTLAQLADALAIHPTKVPSLHRLLRFVVHSNFFSMNKLENGEFTFDLNLNSRLLLKDHPLTQAPFALGMVNQVMIEPAYHLSSWFKDESESPFHVAHGTSIWEYASHASEFNDYFNQAMASDAQFVATFLANIDEGKGLLEGVESLIDVGGGNGTMAKAIAEAYPSIKCTSFDLPHVVEGLKSSRDNLVYVGGDMFEAIPPAQVALLKWVLHDWSDEDCIKILKRCKEAIPSKEDGGKVIIIENVIDDQNNTKKYDVQLLFDMQMMIHAVGGRERTEKEWKKLFINAGFSDYKVSSILGLRSFIEVYP